MKPIVRALFVVSFVAVALVTVACNTTRGAGEDLEAAGQGLQNSAERHGAK